MSRGHLHLRLAAVIGVSAFSFHTAHLQAQEPPECLSLDPADWPAPSRPYFMLAVDTSGSMTACTNPPTVYNDTCPNNATPNSCGLEPTRYNDAKCAIEQTVLAFGGQVNFGLSTFAVELDNCGADCGTATCSQFSCNQEDYSCAATCTNAELNTNGTCGGCGPRPGGAATRAGAIIRVPMLQDHFWFDPPEVTNIPDLLAWTDAGCGSDTFGEELFAAGSTPLNGILRDMQRYFQTGWTHPDFPSISFPTPLASQDLPGMGVNGGTGCRDVNVILLTDGQETCDSHGDAVDAANDLFQTGATVGGKTFKVRTHVIGFAPGCAANGVCGGCAGGGLDPDCTDQIAAAGGTGSSLIASNEVQLAQALANIVAGAVQPETCDNTDNNCNGCTDEGYKHYCNVGQTCCTWNNASERDACIASYEATLPNGDETLLPCITQGQQADPATWLCYDPGDICDESDNNCQDGVDEGQQKCGNPPHCPTAEICNGIDDDCDGQSDEGGVCGTCTPSAEVCDGCDNDCDGIVDNGTFPTLSCGLPSPANCNGTRSCTAPQPAPGGPGTCAPGAGYGTCNNSPQAEVCDGIDNDCDGAIDEGYVSTTCEPTNNPPGLTYGGTSVCQLGNTACVNGAVVCQGGTGPQQELCDGLDNDCNGVVDDGNVFGVGIECGVNQAPCAAGTTACVNGALVCQGGVGPSPEVCDGFDNNCNGSIDEAPLADAPASPGCWNNPGNCCTQPNPNPMLPDLTWCPPAGGTCSGVGSLSAPCNTGTLVCTGGGWTCQGGTLPSPEVCDGIDNDCSGVPDDGTLPQVGQSCGLNQPPCMPGTLACVSGVLDCVGDVGPNPEVCNGIDDDCNAIPDDGIPNQGPCSPSFDMNLYPNSDPTLAPCQPGTLICDFNNPNANAQGFVCDGGIGPNPELCDGIDNDCDGSFDEMGAAPDGIDGSANPNPPPAANIGDACGVTEGICMPGQYACVNGLFACIGGTGPVVETCNCTDDDCDGSEDEVPGPGEPVLCSPGKDCIKAPGFCQCAEPCSSGEFPCPPGQICQEVEIQGSGGVTAGYCVTDYEALCGDCETKTVMGANDTVVCAPQGYDAPGCKETPECVCHGPSGCREPCFNVDCSDGKVCSNFGPTPGSCVDQTCYQTGCPGCNKACTGGSCVDNPCTPDSCPPDQVANPTSDFSVCECVPSCGDVECPSGQMCFEGECIDWCGDCDGGQVCDPSTLTCVDSQCDETSCPDGSWCDPLTGSCGDDPCEGVICPSGQFCEMGSCYSEQGSGAGGGGVGGGGGNTTTTGAGASTAEQGGVFGLPTGGGGCACDLGGRDRHDGQWLALMGLGLVIGARRRRRRGAGLEQGRDA